jgi:hypothetical protein
MNVIVADRDNVLIRNRPWMEPVHQTIHTSDPDHHMQVGNAHELFSE